MRATQSRKRARRDWWLRSQTHTVNSGSTHQSLTTLSVGEAEFYTVVKGGQVGLSLKSMYQDQGIPMKIETQSDSVTATERLGAAKPGVRSAADSPQHSWLSRVLKRMTLSPTRERIHWRPGGDYRSDMIRRQGEENETFCARSLLLDDALCWNFKRVPNAGSPTCLATRRR